MRQLIVEDISVLWEINLLITFKARDNVCYKFASQFMHSSKEMLEGCLQDLALHEENPKKGIFFKKNEGLLLEAYTEAECCF